MEQNKTIGTIEFNKFGEMLKVSKSGTKTNILNLSAIQKTKDRSILNKINRLQEENKSLKEEINNIKEILNNYNLTINKNGDEK